MFSTEWLLSEDTKQLKKHLNNYIEEVKALWSTGQFTGSNMESTMQLNSKALGMVQFAEELLEELSGELYDD